jgi:hypothetical protein
VTGEKGRAAGILVDESCVSVPHPSRRLEFYSPTLTEFGWPEYAIPTYIRSHVHPEKVNRGAGEFVLLSTYRLPTLIHTRSGNAKWLLEISHSNPTWMHTEDAKRLRVETGDLVRIETEIGHFVDRVWVTEGIRPGVVACSHHLGRWRLAEGDGTSRLASALVDVREQAGTWQPTQLRGIEPYESADPDTKRSGGRKRSPPEPDLPVQLTPSADATAGIRRSDRSRTPRPFRRCPGDTKKSRDVFRRCLPCALPGDVAPPPWMLRPSAPPSPLQFPDVRGKPMSAPSKSRFANPNLRLSRLWLPGAGRATLAREASLGATIPPRCPRRGPILPAERYPYGSAFTDRPS